jgi:hypothetical protein
MKFLRSRHINPWEPLGKVMKVIPVIIEMQE